MKNSTATFLAIGVATAICGGLWGLGGLQSKLRSKAIEAKGRLALLKADLDVYRYEDLDRTAPPARQARRELYQISQLIEGFHAKTGAYPREETWLEEIRSRGPSPFDAKYSYRRSESSYEVSLDSDDGPRLTWSPAERDHYVSDLKTATKELHSLLDLKFDDPRRRTVDALNETLLAVYDYFQTCGEIPQPTADILTVLRRGCPDGRRLSNMFFNAKDGWGRPFLLGHENGVPVVFSLGADGQRGGTDMDADIRRTSLAYDDRWQSILAK